MFLQLAGFTQTARFRFVTYSMRQGLSQSMVKKILQDKRGFLWFATQDGLNRFDGKIIRVYQKGTPPKGLPWGNIEDMLDDNIEKRLWIATAERGLCALDYEREEFKVVPQAGKSSLLSQKINAIQQTKDHIWIATDKGVSIVSKKEAVVVKNITTAYKLKSLIVSGSSVLLLSKDGHGYIVNSSTLVIERRQKKSDLFPHKKNINVEAGFADSKKGLWACTRQGVFYAPSLEGLLSKGWEHQKLITKSGRNLSNNVSYCAFTDRKNNLWIGIDSVGLLFKKPGEKDFYLYTHTVVNPYSVADNYFWQIFEDKGGTIWVGTDNGVSKRIDPPAAISSIGQETDPVANRLYRVFSLCLVNDSTLIYGRRGDINIYHLNTDRIEPVQNKTGEELRRFYTIQPYGKGQFLAGHTSGLFLINQSKAQFELHHFNYPELQPLKGETVNAIYQIDEKNFLFGGVFESGLFKWNIKAKKLSRFLHDEKNKVSLINNNVTKICKAANGFWIGTEGGISFFDPVKEKFANYLYPTGTTAGKFVYDILPDGEHLWLALYHEGLGKWTPRTGKLQLYDQRHGLVNTSLYALGKDNSGQIWCSTNGGLSVFNKGRFINYSVDDGLPGNEYNSYSVAVANTRLFFGGINGITIIDKEKGAMQHPAPAIAISEIRYIKGNAFVQYEKEDSVRVHYDQNDIALRYASLDFGTTHRAEYAYQLEGYDKDWIYNFKSNEVAYTNLDPGDYVFKVKAVNPEFYGAPQITSLPVQIIPAWYQTALFKISLILLIATFLFLLVRWYYLARLRKQRTEYEKLLAVQAERQRISAEIHDDIGAGLSGIRLLTEMTRDKIKDADLQKEVGKIHSSVSELSGKMREVIWSLNTDNDNLENLIFYLQRQAYTLFEHSTIKLKVVWPAWKIPDRMIGGEKRRHIYLSVKEAMHNCLKHSGASLCVITMCIKANNLEIEVSDNGKGLPQEQGRWSTGLKNMQKRMNKIRGGIKIKSSEGTSVIFSIPING